MLSKTASAIEQRNEKNKAAKTYKKSKNINHPRVDITKPSQILKYMNGYFEYGIKCQMEIY